MEEEGEYYNTTYPALNGDEFGTVDGDNDRDVDIRRATSHPSSTSSTRGSAESDVPQKVPSTRRKVPSMYDEDMYSLPNTIDETSSQKKTDLTPQTKKESGSTKYTSCKRPICYLLLSSVFCIVIGGTASYFLWGQTRMVDVEGCNSHCNMVEFKIFQMYI